MTLTIALDNVIHLVYSKRKDLTPCIVDLSYICDEKRNNINIDSNLQVVVCLSLFKREELFIIDVHCKVVVIAINNIASSSGIFGDQTNHQSYQPCKKIVNYIFSYVEDKNIFRGSG